MADNGKLGTVMSSAGTNVTAFGGDPGCSFINASIRMVNIGGTEATVKVAVTTLASPVNYDYIEYGAKIAPDGGVLERTCITLSKDEKIIVNASTSNIAIRVDGLVQN